MKTPRVIQFFVQQDPDGGYTASAVEYSIHTQGETLDDTVTNIREAVECHFGDDNVDTNALPIMVNFAVPFTVS